MCMQESHQGPHVHSPAADPSHSSLTPPYQHLREEPSDHLSNESLAFDLGGLSLRMIVAAAAAAIIH